MLNTEKQIRVGMARQGINTVVELASRVGMVRQTLSAKMKHPSTFTASELCSIGKTLKFTDEEVGSLVMNCRKE